MKTSCLNRFMFLLAALLLASGPGRIDGADYPTTVQSFNPVAYWRLNETATVPAPNIITNYGSLGAAGNGYGVSNVLNGFVGIVGNCMSFTNIYPETDNNNLISYCSSKVDVPYNIALNPSGAFTVEAWAKPGATNLDSAGVCVVTSMDPDLSIDANNRAG